MVWTGFLVPPESGEWRIGLTGSGKLVFNGQTLSETPFFSWGGLPKLKTVALQKGRRYPVRVESEAHGMSGVELMWKRVDERWAEDIKAAAADADVIVAAVGLTSDLEGEEMPLKVEGFSGGDKTSLDLPADQRALLEAARKLGKPLVVVLMNGSPIDLTWEKANAAAVLEAWYPGEVGGLAIADALSGRTDPGGRLPLTFYRSVADLPPFGDYAMAGRTYRYFQGEPVYPFGYGLSYTRFDYGQVTVEPAPGGAQAGVRITASVANVGDRPGDEVAELYLTPPPFEGAPRLALRGFQRLSLKPGERRTVSFELSPRDLSFVTRDGERTTIPGTYKVSVGSGQPGTGAPGAGADLVMPTAVPLPP